MWAVEAIMYDVYALCGLLQPLRMMYRRYVGCCILYMGCYILYVGCYRRYVGCYGLYV